MTIYIYEFPLRHRFYRTPTPTATLSQYNDSSKDYLQVQALPVIKPPLLFTYSSYAVEYPLHIC